MIDHFEIKTLNFEQCRNFYKAVLLPLGIELKWANDTSAGYGSANTDKVEFLIEKFDTATPSHIAFLAVDEGAVQQFHQSGIDSGYQCNGKPGIRENYAANYYAAFLLDPDGNNVEAVTYR